MAATRTDGRTEGQPGEGGAVGRRGILAVAGAAVAALLATRTSQPVAAAGGSDGTAMIIAQPNTESTAGTSLSWTGGTLVSGAALAVTDGGPVTPYTAMVSGTATLGKAKIGVYGEGDAGVGGTSTGGTGVAGTSTNGIGVVGYTTASGGSGQAGVYGQGNGSGNFGVVGDGHGGDSGTGAVGVQGQSAQYGVVGKVNNAANTVAVYGNNTSTGAGAIGVYGVSPGIAVYGLSSGSFGVVGGTTAAGGYGGYFATAASHSFGLRAEVQGAATTGSYGLYATAAAPNLAAYFAGDIYVGGSLTVGDMTKKHGLVRGPDGAHHLMYTVEAPESWAEDFGTGTLTNGTATVTIDPLFASLIHTDDYHVFVVSHDGGARGWR